MPNKVMPTPEPQGPPDIHAFASALHARHYANIARALRARQYDARSVRGRQGIRCIRVAVPDSNFWAWWGATAAWCGAITAPATWGAVLYRGAGQIVQAGELLTTIPSTTTDVETIAEGIAIEIDEIEIEAADREFLCLRWLTSLR